jgi:hypothetical protein
LDGHPGSQNSGLPQEPAAGNQIKASRKSNINQAGKGMKPFARFQSNSKAIVSVDRRYFLTTDPVDSSRM